VEVRKSSYGVELLVDGTFASFYEPGSEITGSVWDAIAAPVLALPAGRRRRVLLIGLAAGSVARVVRAIAPKAEIVGVERDADVLDAAERHFGLSRLGIEVVEDDAERFLERERRHFDVLLDDVFIGEGDAVHKPPWIFTRGYALAKARLARGGILVSNTLDEAAQASKTLARLFPHQLSLDIEGYDNRVFAASRSQLNARALRREISKSEVLAPTLSILTLRTRR